ncbi:MAG TPA: mannose-6-phosphate isomerase [Rugosimonospora sp.]|jgi:mannose-6-phosphate isomerase
MLTPIVLPPNQPVRFYRGGAGIARFRGVPRPNEYSPEDFIGSTTEVASGAGVGLTRLDDDTTLRERVEADPIGYLGPRHVETYGTDTGLLVKLLDTGERLLVHFHPDGDFARQHLDCPHGKSEAWYIIDVQVDKDSVDPGAGQVYLGFRQDVPAETVDRWMAGQRSEEMLGALNRIPVQPGDAFFVPAGIPHAIGTGITLVELQEPVDFSILLEWEGFAIDGPREGHLGLGFDVALQALDRSAWPAERLAALRGPRPQADVAPGVTRLLPPAADEFFRADALRVRDTTVTLDPDFAIIVVLDGEGTLQAGGSTLPLRRGDAVLVPYGAGESRISGSIDAMRCRPAGPTSTKKD